MKKFCLVLIFAVMANWTFARNGLEVNVNTQSTLGLEYWFSNQISGIMRFQPGVFDGYTFSPMVIFNLKEFDDTSMLYLGVGLREMEHLENITIPIGMRVYPFENNPRFGFSMELENVFGDNYVLRPSFGLSYKF